MTTLNEQEREALEIALDGGRVYDDVPAVVASILTARLAKVEALADDWEANGNSRELGDPTDRVWFKCATELRAALASDPTHTQNGTQA